MKRFFGPGFQMPLSLVCTSIRLSVCLSVSLLIPSSAALAAPTHYSLDPAQSSVHFDAKATTHDFSGDTQTLTGEMDWDPGDPASVPAGIVRIPVAPIKTGVAPRDRSMRRMFEEKIYPQIEFRAISFESEFLETFGEARLGDAGSPPPGYNDWVTGGLKIRGINVPLTIPVIRRVLPDGSLTVEGDTQVSLERYRLKPPAMMGLIRVLPDIKIHFKSVWKPAEQK